MESAEPHTFAAVALEDPLFILYTTGQSKGVLRDNGRYAIALAWSMKNIFGAHPGDVYWVAADIGWVLGHSYIVHGPLPNGNATVLYEGKPVGIRDAGAFWRLIKEYKASIMFTAPIAFRAIIRVDPEGTHPRKYDLSKFRTVFLAGERFDPDTLIWAERYLSVPVIDHWWQMEAGWAIAANCVGLGSLPVKHGSATKVVPAWNLRVLDEGAKGVPRGEIGALSVEFPLARGALLTLYNADDRYVDTYLREYPDYNKTAGAGYIDDEGYVFVMSRTDGIINTAGHRLSTGAMEEVLANYADVAECAVIGVYDALKGQAPIEFLVLNAGVSRPHSEIEERAIHMVRRDIGPVSSFKTALTVERLPKTRSGKVFRGTIQKIADGLANHSDS